ncbi:TetR/AcrR family transcriptional regulator [Vagococcus sp. PNs007]|uniref:TetR/AcrR family transcriptional regulator n=1 Tax=Vagococcus proximus TaxID=2991417 RepID=A0ABT5X335_9ENTE|nr:TetR/AcrR family transcriptional regulator [Vagococcus proximus]MDF0480281.1 TetR/AcrR family transcriptional regulator [Vagococcus proximus]
MKHSKSYFAIQNALYKLLEQSDLKQLTINDICEQANVGRSTFYHLFHDKYEILEKENEALCQIVDDSLKEVLTMSNLELHLNNLIQTLNHTKFLQLIDIEEGGVNLRKDLRNIFEQNYILYYDRKMIQKKWGITFDFAKDLFCSTTLTFIESSIKSQDEEDTKNNINFIKEMINMFLVFT